MKIVILLMLMLFIYSCDNSFNPTEPFSYQSKADHIENTCLINSDCKDGLICSLSEKKCVISPCVENNIDCSNHGICIVDNLTLKTSCICDDDYQDYDSNNTCLPKCLMKNICFDNNTIACDDSSGKAICSCKENYFQNDIYQCVTPCDNIDCKVNEYCKEFDSENYICDCNENYFKDDDNNCVNPCENIDCNNHGRCIANSIDDFYCECNENEGVYQDDDDILNCVSPCEGHETCNGYGNCIVEDKEKAFCNCNTKFQDYDNDLICEISCKSEQVCILNVKGNKCKDNTGTVICECEDGYFQNDAYQCVSPCNNNSCGENEKCVADSVDDFHCDCVNNYFKDDNNNCVNPCENIDCNNHGRCIANSIDDFYCECNENEGFYQDKNNILSCISPCGVDETCGGNGACIAVNSENAFCNCNIGFQDNDKDLICDKSCSNEDICIDNSSGCSDLTGIATCVCNQGYFQNNNYECVSPCNNNSCGENEKCVADSVDDFHCDCVNNYFRNNESICVNPCENIDCNNHGNCVANSINDTYCICNESEGFYQNENNSSECISPCGIDKNCGGNGICTVLNKDTAFCECNIGFQDSNNDLICDKSCNNETVCVNNSNGCNDYTGTPICLCKDSYFQNDNYECINPCDEPVCSLKEKCVSSSLTEFECSCKDNYFKDENGNCFSPCENHETCGGNGICLVEENNEPICIQPFGCFENKELVASCTCNTGYQDNDSNLVCTKTCDNITCSNHGICDDSDGFAECNCEAGYNVSVNKKECTLINGYIDTTILGDNYSLASTRENNNNLIVSDKLNNIYMAYFYINTITNITFLGIDLSLLFDTNLNIGFIIKKNPSGRIEWVHYIQYPSGYCRGGALTINEDNNVVYATNNSIVKLDDFGKEIMGIGNLQEVYGITTDSENSIYVTGYFIGTKDLNPYAEEDSFTSKGGDDIFITKFDKDGGYLWSRVIGSSSNDRGIALTKDIADNIYLGGRFEDNIDLNFEDDNDENTTSDVDIHSGAGTFVIKIDKNGNYKWGKSIINNIDDLKFKILVDSLFNIYISFFSNSNSDIDFSEGVVLSGGNYQKGVLTKINSDGSFGGYIAKKEYLDFDIDNKNYVYIVYPKDEENDKKSIVFSKLNSDLVTLDTIGLGDVLTAEEDFSSIKVTNSKRIHVLSRARETTNYDFDPSENIDSISVDDSLFLWRWEQIPITTSCEGYETCCGNGICSESEGVASCTCNAGFQDNDSNLVCTKTCDNITCSNHGVCDDSNGAVKCNCNIGYQESLDHLECFYEKDYLSTIDLTNNLENIDILSDSNNNLYLTGVFNGTKDFDFTTEVDEKTVSNNSIFITKINSDNTYGWTQVIENNNTYDNKSVISLNDDIYIVTESNKLIKISTNGVILWQKDLVFWDYNRVDIKVDSNDNIFIYGTFYGISDFNTFDDYDENTTTDVDMHTSNGYTDIFLTKLDTNGDYLWTKTFGSTNYDEPIDLDIDSLGNIYILGVLNHAIDLNFNENEEFLVEPITGRDIFLSKISASGMYLESKIFNIYSGDMNMFSINIDNDNNVYIKGVIEKSCEGNICNDFNPDEEIDFKITFGNSLFLTKLDTSLTYQWTNITLNNSDILPDSFSNFFDSNGVNYIFYENIANQYDAVDTISSDGMFLERNIYNNNNNNDFNFNLQKMYMKNDYLYLYGFFNGTVDFDPTEAVDELNSGGSFFLSKYKLGN